MDVDPFPIEGADVANEAPTKKKKVTEQKRKPRFQALNDDMLWIAEQDIARTKHEMQINQRPMTDKEHARFIKTSEQLRKLRLTDAELNKLSDPGTAGQEDLMEEFEERCEEAGLDPEKVRKVMGF